MVHSTYNLAVPVGVGHVEELVQVLIQVIAPHLAGEEFLFAAAADRERERVSEESDRIAVR